jgi:hypothetical protein
VRDRTLFFAFCLLCLASFPPANAQDLFLGTGDIVVENHGDPGLHLYVRKKPDIGSVMLTESTKDPDGIAETLAYRAPEWNPVNGDERRVSGEDVSWSLVDSTPENHPLLEEAFHIYIPPLIVYGTEEGRQGTVAVSRGTYINIRTFSLPYADYEGAFEDNPFTLDYFIPFGPEPIPPPVVPIEPETEAILPDPSILLAEEEPVDTIEEEQPSLDADRDPFIFAPQVEARFGLRVFFPGPRGNLLTSLPLKSTYNPVGSITLTQPINETQRIIVEVERESFSLNRIIARAAWDIGIVGLEAGSYMGILNTEPWNISPGLSLALRLQIPALNLSGFFRLDSALGREPSIPGEYTQSYVSLGLSYAFPWTKFTLGMVERGSSVIDSENVLRVGRWTRYNLTAEFPPVPERWDFRVELGVEQLQWDYKQPLITLKYDGDITAYIGFETSYTFPSGFLALIAGLEAPVYPFVYPVIFQNLSNPAAAFFSRVTLGVRLTPQP